MRTAAPLLIQVHRSTSSHLCVLECSRWKGRRGEGHWTAWLWWRHFASCVIRNEAVAAVRVALLHGNGSRWQLFSCRCRRKLLQRLLSNYQVAKFPLPVPTSKRELNLVTNSRAFFKLLVDFGVQVLNGVIRIPPAPRNDMTSRTWDRVASWMN